MQDGGKTVGLSVRTESDRTEVLSEVQQSLHCLIIRLRHEFRHDRSILLKA